MCCVGLTASLSLWEIPVVENVEVRLHHITVVEYHFQTFHHAVELEIKHKEAWKGWFLNHLMTQDHIHNFAGEKDWFQIIWF